MTTATLPTDEPAAPQRAARHVPGEVGVWIVIFGELLTFGALFVGYLVTRSNDPQLFAEAQEALHPTSGAALTLILLTASFLVAVGIRAVREGQGELAVKIFRGAALLGWAFTIIKGVEYYLKISDGLTPNTNDFYLWYYILTGWHWLHLDIGLTVLAILIRRARKPHLAKNDWIIIEGGACYWHMIDFLWILIFPLLYLVK